MKIDIKEHLLHFRQPAGTSRGTYTTRKLWIVTIVDASGRMGVGECAPLPDLSCDAMPDYEPTLRKYCDIVEATGQIPYDLLRDYPSMLFGIETAMFNYHRQTYDLFDTPFGKGEVAIPINGLVWMGTYDQMLQRISEKLDQGFRCVKLKIGAIDMDRELDLLRIIRESYPAHQIELRVDANGAFGPDDALSRLEALARYDLHSIEQPISQGQWKQMAQLCRQSPIDIALDEELIGVNDPTRKAELLDTISPQYIILKPSLHGGVSGTTEWIDMANRRGIGSWITSALESNVGLNAIAQTAAHIYGDDITMPQGLGTGQLFTDNIELPIKLTVEKGALHVES